MKKIIALSVFMLVLFSATSLFAQEVQKQNKYQYKSLYSNFIDENGDGICDLSVKNGMRNKYRESMNIKTGRGHKYGPGDGTGTGIGPKDGTGFGSGNGSGTGTCDGTGPKGNRGGR